MSHIRYGVDESDEVSDTDEEYNENEKILLKNVRRGQTREHSDSEEEVLGVGESGNEEDSESDIAVSDIEGQEEEDDIPNIRAWGKDKKKYYGADYVDPDYDGYQEKDIHDAEIEEDEARNLQNQLIQQLDDGDFSLDVIFKKSSEDKEKNQVEEIIKSDLSQLTKKQKLEILKKESPEFFGLVNDFEGKIMVAKDYLYPIIQRCKKGKLQACKAVEFVETYYKLILNYSTNIYMYLLLKLNKELQNHPVIKRLYQYRQLFVELDPVFEEIVKPQIITILDGSDILEEQKSDKKKKTLKLLSNLPKEMKPRMKPNKRRDESVVEKPAKKPKITTESDSSFDKMDDESATEEMHNDTPEISESTKESEKRAITYQMAKNKGLTPHRKKEQRNPRVKHKLKYRKAIIRRKGAVREPRRELSRYSGEISGIKTSVSKSIKIKT